MMISIRWLIFLIVAVHLCQAGQQEELFLQAGNAYKAKDYKKAFEMYESIETKNAATYYNLGNCAYKCDEPVTAYIYWKKAQRQANSTLYSAIAQNIDVGLVKLEQSQNMAMVAKLFHHVYTMLKKIPCLFAQLLFLLIWWGFLIMIVYVQRRSLLIMLTMIVGMVSVGMVVGVHYQITHTIPAIVVKNDATLYAGPDERYHALGELALLDDVIILGTNSEWSKVSTKNGSGWIKTEFLELL